MADKTKITSLLKYIGELTDKLSTSTPVKHAGHPKEYKEYLVRELSAAKTKVEKLKTL